MELNRLPFPVAAKQPPVLTVEEQQKVTAALAAGWKRYCTEQIYETAEQAVAAIYRSGSHHQWSSMDLAARKAILPGVTVADDLLADGWPLHGVLGKLAKYRSQPARLAYAVLTANLPSARKKAIWEALHVLIDLDEAFLQRCQSIGGEVDALMASKVPPKNATELAAALDVPLDAAHWVGEYMKVKTGRPAPTWDEFKAAYAVEMTMIP